MTAVDSPTSGTSEGQADPAVFPHIDPFEAFGVIWKRRKLIAIVTGAVTALSVAVSLILPAYYRSSATILPETQSGKLSSLGGLTDLAALAGVNVGTEGSLVKLYPTIVKGEAVLRDVIYKKYRTQEYSDSVNLIRYWDIKEDKPGGAYDAALRKLRELLDVSMDIKTNVLTISLETKEPQLSADIINSVVDELDKFILTKRMTSASEQRKFIEGRLSEVREDLGHSEDALRNFRERNVQVRSPQLLLEQGRLEREVQINTTIFVELKKQYELAKIEEVKNTPVVNVMDVARAAAKKDWPKRTVIVLTTFLATLFAMVVYVVGERFFGREVREWVLRLRRSL